MEKNTPVAHLYSGTIVKHCIYANVL